jgi:hypothetical protein
MSVIRQIARHLALDGQSDGDLTRDRAQFGIACAAWTELGEIALTR